MARQKSLRRLQLEATNIQDITDLPTDALVLFNLLALVVNIEYRRRYGRELEWTDGKGYSKTVQIEEIDEYEDA